MGHVRLVGASQDLSLLGSLISVAGPVFARLGHSLEAEVSVSAIIVSVTGNQSRYFQRGELKPCCLVPSWVRAQTNDSSLDFQPLPMASGIHHRNVK